MIKYRIDRNTGFTSLTITDYQLSLTAPNWYQRVDRGKTGKKRNTNRNSVNYTSCFFFNKVRSLKAYTTNISRITQKNDFNFTWNSNSFTPLTHKSSSILIIYKLSQ